MIFALAKDAAQNLRKDQKMELSFYPGCTAHSTGIEYSMSLHAVCDALGVKLLEIDDWNCCGAAGAHSISQLLGLALPARNIAKAQRIDLPLVIPCAGCFNYMRKAQEALSADGPTKQKLEEMVGFKYEGKLQIQAMIDVVINRYGLDKVKSFVKQPLSGLKVASYYGCALVRRPEITRMGDHENPLFQEEMVECLGGEAMEWSYKTDCCGADLAITHGAMVADMADRIVGAAIEAGANCLMCHCGLCQVNLEMRQTGKNGVKLPVFYFTELMGVAMGLPDRGAWWDKHMVKPERTLEPLNLLE